jgi:hypothetical protein
MTLSAGMRLTSGVCGTQVAVIRAPSAPGVLTCGGSPMGELGKAPAATELAAPEPGHALPGKRYVDEATGLELLCTKAGKGALAFEGRPLTPKLAKPLPASD